MRVIGIWSDANASTMGAAVAFYTIFAIGPLFLLVLALASAVFGHDAARRELFGQIQGLVGKNGGQAIQSMLSAASKPKASLFATIGGLVTLFVGASSVFVQLQDALNAIWEVHATSSSVRSFVVHRLLSFAVLLGIGFLLLVSLVISAGINAAGNWIAGVGIGQDILWQTLDFVISVGISVLLFALIFKTLPDVKIRWHDVWIGSFITALLFAVGKFLLGAYLGRTSLGSAYGAAGSFVIVLLWVYYSTQILLLGAASVRVYANRHGAHIRPRPHARMSDETA